MLEICQLILISLMRFCVDFGRRGQIAFSVQYRVWAMFVRHSNCSRLLQQQVALPLNEAISCLPPLAAWEKLWCIDKKVARVWCPIEVQPISLHEQLRW